MTITIFTSNQPRHVALIETLAEVADEIYAIQECTTVFPGQVADFYQKSDVMQRYFTHVIAAEREVFGGPRFPKPSPRKCNVHQLAIKLGDLNSMPRDAMASALEADRFVVFGASYIRGALCDLLVHRKAVNLHIGVSPYYRGGSTNFWALHDRRPEMVGATIHQLTHGLDSGPILMHALPPRRAVDPFVLGMLAVRAGQDALVDAIRTGEINNVPSTVQDKTRQIRYTRAADFTDDVASEYLSRLMSPAEIAEKLDSRDPADYVYPRTSAAPQRVPLQLQP